jgi:tetratricopeptide (TPR) repeat protein
MTVGTATGTLMGTVEYMAPEQASGSRVDQRADIYAFGLIVHEMLVGRRRSSDTALGELMLRTREAPPSVRTLDPQIPEAIDRIVARCLRPDPAERYQTSAELAADLAKLDSAGYARSEGIAPLPLPARSRWLVPGLALIAVVLLAALVSLWMWGRRPPAAAVAREPVSLLVADFDNKAGDPVFDGSLEQALSIAMEGASFVTAYPHSDAERVLGGVSKGAKLGESGARLVARREGIKVVLSGSIAAADSRYTITVRVLDPSNDEPSATVNAASLAKGEVLGAIASLAVKVRTVLGDPASASARKTAAETFTAASLEAMREYSLGQDLLLGRKDNEAIEHYRKAVEHDPQFGRAYAGWAVAAHTIGRDAEAGEQWQKAVALIDRMTEREKYRTLGGYYLGVSRDYEKAIENFETLVRLYPADTGGHSNLALAYFYVLNFPKAFEEGRRAIALWPNIVRFRSNYALYAMYAGDFATAAKESQALIQQVPGSYDVYLPLAIAQAATGNLQAARETYARMAAVDRTGQATATTGLADLALYEGRVGEARAILAKGIVEDQRAGITAAVISKQAALGEAALIDGNKRAALAAADALVKLGRREEMLVPAAVIYLAAGRDADAQQFAAELQKKVPPQARAYGKVIEGQLALKRGRRAEAVDAFRAAQKLADLWLTRYSLGVAYVENGLYAEALSELEKCEKRRGEATALFLDDWPTFRYLAPLSYWLGRANEGLNMKPAAAEHYKQFLTLRPEGSTDPLAIDARKRVAAQ